MELKHNPVLDEALNGTPDWYDLPEDMEEQIRAEVVKKERFFWLAAQHIEKDEVTEALLRRAIYAEQRCFESESRLGEMALITKAAAEAIERYKKKLAELANATGQKFDSEFDFDGVKYDEDDT